MTSPGERDGSAGQYRTLHTRIVLDIPTYIVHYSVVCALLCSRPELPRREGEARTSWGVLRTRGLEYPSRHVTHKPCSTGAPGKSSKIALVSWASAAPCAAASESCRLRRKLQLLCIRCIHTQKTVSGSTFFDWNGAVNRWIGGSRTICGAAFASLLGLALSS